MTDLTDDQVRALLDGATPGRRVQFHGSYCPEAVGTPFTDWDTSHDVSVIRPDGSRYRLAHYKHASDAYLSQMAPDLARALLDCRARSLRPDPHHRGDSAMTDTNDLARTDAPELLPCPFCGGEAHIDGTSWTTRDGKDQAWATCRKCGTYGPSSTDAVAAWNRRAPTALAARGPNGETPVLILCNALDQLAAAKAETERLRYQINEASDPDFLFGAMDNVNDMDVSLDDFARAASRAIRAALSQEAG